MSFGSSGFGGFGQSNNQQSSGFGGFGSNNNTTSGMQLYVSPDIRLTKTMASVRVKYQWNHRIWRQYWHPERRAFWRLWRWRIWSIRRLAESSIRKQDTPC